MFTIYHSNHVDLLKSLVSELMDREPLDTIFTEEVVIVQSLGMAQWLQIELANELGILANIEFPFPTQFIWRLYQQLLPNIPNDNHFNTEFMTWRLFSLLPKMIDEPAFSSLKHYLSVDKQERKLYQLAARIAGLFDQYLVYRPDWIARWELGQKVTELNGHVAEVWQAQLWRALIANTQSNHRANIYQQMRDILLDESVDVSRLTTLPKRIFIFGITSLPPIYLSLLSALGRHIDVHLMFCNPCKWYWGDIVDKQLSDLSISENKVPNPLLTSWGKLGRDNLFLLQEFDDKRDIEAFVDYEPDCLLHAIQQDILELYPDELRTKHVDRDDESITFHRCHSEQREVEVLYDYLLSAFDNDPDLQLRDCIVMVSDIDRYVPYIQAVFGNASEQRYLPFTISDLKARNIDPIVQGFFAILNFPQSRFTSEDIFNLLEIPAISARFGINESQLMLLRTWIVESGIRFGLANSHSWLFGLERLLLGYTMSQDNGSWQHILPYDGATGLDAVLIGQLAEFLGVVRKWFAILSEPKTLQDWQGCCIDLLTDFFVTNTQNQSILLLIEEEWQKLIQGGLATEFNELISIIILHDAMQSRFEQNHLAQRFLVGKINFCTMMPMRSIPFKVVCLLGMNDGVYPRISLPLDFDLIAQHARRGDRSRRNDDRYLFLEAILSAQQKLYMSYIGREMKDDTERYPSVLVDELWQYITQSYSVNHQSIAQSSSLDFLHISHTRMPFNPLNFISPPQSYADEWLPAAAKQGQHSDFMSAISPITVETVSLDELKRFYHHSIRFFLQKRFHYYVNPLDDELPDAENFSLHALARYKLNQRILERLITTDSHVDQESAFYQQLALSGELPDGAFGEIVYQDLRQSITPLAEKIQQERQTMTTQEVNLRLADCQLQGWLTHVQTDGLLTWRPTKLSIREGISLWIDHLIYCLLNPDSIDSQSRMYGRENSEWRFSFIDPSMCLNYLEALVKGYYQGINHPLLMPLKSAWNWLVAAYDLETGQIAMNKKALSQLMSTWQGGFNQSAECDEYYFRLYPELTETHVEQITQAAQHFLFPILSHCERAE